MPSAHPQRQALGATTRARGGVASGRLVGDAVARTARDSYGKLIALLAAPTRDLALAEDALADAFEQALRVWGERGTAAVAERRGGRGGASGGSGVAVDGFVVSG